MFCKLVEHVPGRPLRNAQCRVCDHHKQHPISSAIDGTNNWWQSPSIQNGRQYHWVTITLDLRQELKGKEAQQLGSLAKDKAIDKGIGKKAGVLSLWQRLLSSVKDRYPFKEELRNSQSKWTSIEGAMLEVIYSNLDNDQAYKDLDEIWCTQSMWQKFVRNAPTSYTHTLAIMSWTDTEAPTIDELARQLREYEDNLASLMWACVLAVDRLTQKMSEQAEKGRSSSRTPTKALAIKSQPFSVQGKGYWGHTPREHMRKWDGEPTWRLEAWIQELQGKTTAKKHPSRKITAPCTLIPSEYKGAGSICISGVMGGSQELSVLEAEVSLTGNEWQKHPIVTGPEALCILGLDYLRREYFKDPKGYWWAFGTAALSTEKIKQLSSLPGLSEDLSMVGLLQVKEQQVPVATMTSNGEWRLTVDYRGLNKVTLPLSAAIPDMLELQYKLELKAAKWYATIDIANVFFLIPLPAECRPQFAFIWRSIQYTWNRLPQGWKHSPAICHGLIQTALEQSEAPEHLQYIDDIIVWGNTAEEVFEKGRRIIQMLLKVGFAIKQSKIKGPAQEIQFLGIKWQDGRRHIPWIKKETQAILGVTRFWRMHIPGYSLIVSPLYQVTRKKNDFEWGPEQQQAFEQIKREIVCAVALGPIQTGQDMKNMLYTSARDNSSTWSLWQKAPGQPLGFWSRGYRGSEAHYTPTEKEILAAYEGIWAASEAVGTEAQLLLAPRLPVLGWMFKGRVSTTHHATVMLHGVSGSLVMQWAQMGNSDCLGVLKVIMDWPEG
ncbi:hypothetical protein QYF61_015114 [Mycteria americana]|uniref:ribonuclease H n=1 Tax=Mycteria americana TaxID=33587 RepID=A0AAN7NJG1_MYCAM|nr:hypothetical protein QYF61_015114 [Mycteria americana]